ncbi:hypothetical protein K2W90_00205 [Candidatus Babeliales bacterium]|nr:hypothetical protein [Candidatus Babeliales bacterium]
MKNGLAFCSLLFLTTPVWISAQTPAPALQHVQQLSHAEFTALVEQLTSGPAEKVDALINQLVKQQHAHFGDVTIALSLASILLSIVGFAACHSPNFAVEEGFGPLLCIPDIFGALLQPSKNKGYS